MSQNNDWRKTQILRKYLEGFSQEEIAHEFDISEGTVSSYLQELRDQDETVTYQHEIAVVCKKYNITIPQLASNLAFSNAIKIKGFDALKIHLLLRGLNKMVSEDGSFSPEKVGIMIIEICNFMEINKLDKLDQTHRIIKQKSDELDEIKKQISQSRKVATSSKEREIQAMKKRRLTFSELRRFALASKVFKRSGIDLDNFQEFSNVISSINKLDRNPKLIIEEMKKTNDIESRKFSLRKDCQEAEKNLEELRKQQQQRASYNYSYNVAVDLANKILMRGVPSELINSLFNTIIQHQQYASIQDFIDDFETYGNTKSVIFKTKRELEDLEIRKYETNRYLESHSIS